MLETSSKFSLKGFSIFFLLGSKLLSIYCFTVFRIRSRSFRILFFRSSGKSSCKGGFSLVRTGASIIHKNEWIRGLPRTWNSTLIAWYFTFPKGPSYNYHFKKYFNSVLKVTSKKNWIQIKILATFKEVQIIVILCYFFLVQSCNDRNELIPVQISTT